MSRRYSSIRFSPARDCAKDAPPWQYIFLVLLLQAWDFLGDIADNDPGRTHDTVLSVFENTTLGISFMGAAGDSFEVGQYDAMIS